MRRYFDTAVLLKLYIREANSDEVVALTEAAPPPLPFTHLHRLEIKNAIYLKTGRNEISSAEAKHGLALLQHDLASGLLHAPQYDLAASFNRAEDLAVRHAAPTLARSLDILHVAIALEIECDHLVSFDNRQRAIAKRAGLKVLPNWKRLKPEKLKN